MSIYDLGQLARLAAEFFYGEALYGMDDSLRRLRKWRLVTVMIPTTGLAMVLICAVNWPQVPPLGTDQSQSLGRLEYKVETLDKTLDQQRILVDRIINDLNLRALAIVELKGEINVINKKLDLIGWLVGAAAIGFVGQTFSYFYQLRLRKTLRGIEKRESDESSAAR